MDGKHWFYSHNYASVNNQCTVLLVLTCKFVRPFKPQLQSHRHGSKPRHTCTVYPVYPYSQQAIMQPQKKTQLLCFSGQRGTLKLWHILPLCPQYFRWKYIQVRRYLHSGFMDVKCINTIQVEQLFKINCCTFLVQSFLVLAFSPVISAIPLLTCRFSRSSISSFRAEEPDSDDNDDDGSCR